jgi:sialidase-1
MNRQGKCSFKEIYHHLTIFIFILLLFQQSGFSKGRSGSGNKYFSFEIANSSQSSEKKVFRILPGPGNPRNSEGDFVTLKDGRILFVYSRYTGMSGGDNASAFLAGRFSSDGGITWSSEDDTIVRQEGKMNVMSVSLIRLRNGKIALFYLRKNSETDCIPVMRLSDDEARSWSSPHACITDRKGYFVVNNSRVIQLKSGRILIPVAIHKPKWQDMPEFFSMSSYYSDDDGVTWKPGKEAENPGNILTQEPGVAELKNGNILMIIRTNTGFQYKSLSTDKGETWSPVERTGIASPLSPAAIARIPSTGDLLLVWNNNGKNQKRTPLCVSVSKDEGRTWGKIKDIEVDPEGSFCYPAIHFDGKQVLIGYWNRANKNSSSSDIALLSLKWIYK